MIHPLKVRARDLILFGRELAIVAIGVLLALAADEWMQSKRDKENWIAAHASIKADLAEGHKELSKIPARISQQIERNNSIKIHLHVSNDLSDDGFRFRTIIDEAEFMMLIGRFDSWYSALATGTLKEASNAHINGFAAAIYAAEEIQATFKRIVAAQISAKAILTMKPIKAMSNRERAEAIKAVLTVDYELELLEKLVKPSLALFDEALALPDPK